MAGLAMRGNGAADGGCLGVGVRLGCGGFGRWAVGLRQQEKVPQVAQRLAARFDSLADVFGRLGGFFGEFLDLVGDDGKALARSPARAASMVALSASRFVCWAIDVMTLITLPISAARFAELGDRAVGGFRDFFTAAVATWAASVAFLAIARMLAPISSMPVATVCTFAFTFIRPRRPPRCSATTFPPRRSRSFAC